ncbi:venom metalloproteinase antarease-like TtrivMP_A [Dermacentor silvarum]|uniref:venom metalloproteinase antarease-like TtrivMP_A n=1 Tax=Dermacentor silvarum TaxID=543639 RepID=UPI002101D1B6|nr:venom metalloproteinase antarease-like TtrivMP_A [Dermacentor silvarum]
MRFRWALTFITVYSLQRTFYCFLVAATTARDVFAENSLKVFPEVYDGHEEGFDKLVVIQGECKLTLKKASVLAKKLLLREVTENGIVERYIDGTYYDRYLYHDINNQALLLVEPNASGGYKLFGLLNFTHGIEPIVSGKGMTLEPAAHVIHKVEATHRTKRIIEPTVYKQEAVHIEPRESSSSFVAETYLILESSLANRIRTGGNDLQAYASFFMAMVSLILQQLEPPGMILLTTIQINNVGQEEYVAFTNDNHVDSSKTLKNLVLHAAKNKDLQRADMIVCLIGREMVQVNPGGATHVSHGATFTGKACTPQNVVVVADNRKKNAGVISAAHEIGHLLGSPHDGSDTSKDCPADAGLIMSPRAEGTIRPRFSNCSKDAISYFVTTYARCLFQENDPMPTTSTPEAAITTEAAPTTDEIFEKKRTRKCEKFLLKDHDLLRAEQMDGKNTRCTVLCTAISRTTKQESCFAVVAPNGTPCDPSDSSKMCRRGLCK